MNNKIKSLLAGAALMLSFALVAPPVSAHEGHDYPKKKSKKKAKKRAQRARVAVRQADGHTHRH